MFLLAAGAAAGLALLWAVISWLLANWWALIVLGALAVLGATVWAHHRRQRQAWDRVRQQALRYGLPQLDALHHRDFEYAVRDLMRRDGCTDARQIGGAGDNGADVLATDPLGRTWVIQCKHRKDGDRGSAVGTPDLQRVNGTARQLYGADVVLVVTKAASPPAAHPSRRSCTCTLPTGGSSRRGRAGGARCGNCSRRFPRPARAGSPCGDRAAGGPVPAVRRRPAPAGGGRA